MPIGPMATLYRGDSGSNVVKQMTSKSGVITGMVTLTASSTDQYAVGTHWSFSVKAVTHAFPINWRTQAYIQGGVHHNPIEVNNTTGVLIANWAWDSSDGKLADLAHCPIYEIVDFSGNAQGSYGISTDGKNIPVYLLPSPPCATGSNYENPTKTSVPDPTAGMRPDTFSPPLLGWMMPYMPAHWSGNQGYYFDDPADGLTQVTLYKAGRIDRNVILIAVPSRYKYTVTHLGQTATLPSLH